MKRVTIDNSNKAAVESKKWEPNKKKLLETAMSSSTPMTLVKEIFLQVDKNRGNDQTLTVGMVHYPHHDIIEKTQEPHHIKYTCVLNKQGVQAAYARAKQMGVYEGAIKEHIDEHRKELKLDIKDDKLQEAADNINQAFDMLTEALKPASSDTPDESDSNMFEEFMSEAPTVSMGKTPNQQPPAAAAAPQQPAPAQAAPPAQPQAQPAAPAEPSPQPQDQPATIPVQDLNPSEDTSTNNPNEGPDTRDQDSLDGNARKEQYQAFADALKAIDGDNVFGTIFDDDIFKSEYRIVPYEMRFFYRLQNPISVASGDFEFIPFGADIIDAQEKYDLGKKMFVFATYSEKPVFFNQLDKTIWFNDKKVGETFDGFIDKIVQDQGNIDFTEDDSNDANVVDMNNQAAADPNNPLANDAIDLSDPNAPDPNAPLDLSAAPEAPPAESPNNDFGPENLGAPAAEPAPLDLTQQNASLDNDSILSSFTERDQHGYSPSDPLYDIGYDKDYRKCADPNTGREYYKHRTTGLTIDSKKFYDDRKARLNSEYSPTGKVDDKKKPKFADAMTKDLFSTSKKDDTKKESTPTDKKVEDAIKQNISNADLNKSSGSKDHLPKGVSRESYNKELIKEIKMATIAAGGIVLTIAAIKKIKEKVMEMMESVELDGSDGIDAFTESDDSILDYMTEGTAFPNDALDERNRMDAERRKQRHFGTFMTD